MGLGSTGKVALDGGEPRLRPLRGAISATNVLLTPGRIGSVEIRNRIVMAPMTTRLADEDGFVTDNTIDYYTARAVGGVGLVTVEMASPTRAGRHRRRELGIYDDRFLPGLKWLATSIRRGGARASIQLGHGGGHTRADICGETPVAPSAVQHSVFEVTEGTVIPKEMTSADIEFTVAGFAAAAARAEEAGFDCVEIHAAHGYLISQFLNPVENLRNDAYGGALVNRARFGLEVLAAVKAAVRIPVIFRLSVDDYFPGGLAFEEGRQVAIMAARAGADALHVAAGHYRSLPSAARMIPPMHYPDATFLSYAADIRKEVTAPVIAVGRLGEPAVARHAIESGKADFVALGRTLLADPDWVAKVMRGEPPRHCLACNTCVNEMRGGTHIQCVVNAVTGDETRYAAARPPQGERIAVIGGGPAGLSYAHLVADGNRVTVFERENTAGGVFRRVGKTPLFQDVAARQAAFDRYIENMVAACMHRGVIFLYGVDVIRSPEPLANYDRIVIATGARYPLGLTPLVNLLLRHGLAHWPLLRRFFASNAFRNWLYHRARRGTGTANSGVIRPTQKTVVIGDALKAGKSRPAIVSAFEAALLS
jgi:2,4-dienoyl-CoA reductase-like NADH-dependent reductase (Old Yellow Enzyme family)